MEPPGAPAGDTRGHGQLVGGHDGIAHQHNRHRADRADPVPGPSGLLLAGFGLLWAGFAVAAIRRPADLGAAWRRVRHLPLPVEALAWLLLLPVLAGLWVWCRPSPQAGRSLVVASIAA